MNDFNPQDAAAPILAGDPQLDDQTRANLWDAFHTSKDPNELSRVIEPFAIPDDTKQRLLAAKQPPQSPVTSAIGAMSALPAEALDMAEQHPTVLKAIIESMKTPEEAGKEAEVKKPPLSPRPDGQKHFPPIPEGHYRVLASDGGVHDIPHANIELARQIDPLLHVLNA